MNRQSWWLALLPCLLGCGAAAPTSSVSYAPGPGDAASAESIPKPGESAAEEVSEPTAGRKIIYKASLVLDVKDFAETERQLAALIKQTGSFVAQFKEERPYGAQRGGRWTVRVPVPQFDSFVEGAGQLGVAHSRDINSEDVTEEFVDLAARLKNKQQLEARLLELVAQRGDEIKDVLALEAELSRVREEIERMQGRLRYLTDRVSLTTVEIAAYERQEYQPPEAPTFAGQIHTTFFDSLGAMQKLGEALVLCVVALGPWLVALVILAAPLAWLVRRWLRHRSPATVTATAV